MKPIITWFFLSVLSLVICPTRAVSAATGDQAGVDALIANFSKAFNAHDPKAFTANFAPDADFTNWLGSAEHGSAAIEESHVPVLTILYKNAVQKITAQKVRFIRPDVAAVDVWVDLSGGMTRDGKPMPLLKFLLNWTVTKEPDGRWLIQVMHNTRILPVEFYNGGTKSPG